jgi:hypothetical protein
MKIAALKLKATLPTEDQECQCLIEWARVKRYKGLPLSNYLIMVPNGAYLGGDLRQRQITMARMKRTGFKAGVFDYLLAIPRDGLGGLWIELKRRHLGVVSLEQSQFQMAMLHAGYEAVICKGWAEAKDAIEAYLA